MTYLRVARVNIQAGVKMWVALMEYLRCPIW